MNQANDIQVKRIWQADERTLGVAWTDGRDSRYDVVELRRRCPCASCVDEWTRKPILKESDVPETVRPHRVRSIGRYAMAFEFSDGHSTGIYSYNLLRDLG